jgi:hypothetical protein
LIVAVVAVLARPAAAQDVELELTEDGLNRIVAQLGDPSSGGMHQPNVLGGAGYTNCRFVASLDCPGDRSGGAPVPLLSCDGPDRRLAIVPGAAAVSWQWWITKARFIVQAQQLQFTAIVRYRVGDAWFKEERTVPATLGLDVGAQRLRMSVSAFRVPLQYREQGVVEAITEVDVGRHMSFAVPIATRTFQVRDLAVSPRTLTSRAQGANVDYLPGKIRVSIDAAFN